MGDRTIRRRKKKKLKKPNLSFKLWANCPATIAMALIRLTFTTPNHCDFFLCSFLWEQFGSNIQPNLSNLLDQMNYCFIFL